MSNQFNSPKSPPNVEAHHIKPRKSRKKAKINSEGCGK